MTNEPLLRLDLPYPPTIGKYWGHRVVTPHGRKSRVQMYIRESGKAFREAVDAIAEEIGRPKISPGDGQLVWMRITVFPPDRRKRDLDNVNKPLLDALENAGVFEDDYLVGRIVAQRLDKVPGGLCHVELGVYDATEVTHA